MNKGTPAPLLKQLRDDIELLRDWIDESGTHVVSREEVLALIDAALSGRTVKWEELKGRHE